eukprot:1159112-Pelagomonas_calceolata.AAC.3
MSASNMNIPQEEGRIISMDFCLDVNRLTALMKNRCRVSTSHMIVETKIMFTFAMEVKRIARSCLFDTTLVLAQDRTKMIKSAG